MALHFRQDELPQSPLSDTDTSIAKLGRKVFFTLCELEASLKTFPPFVPYYRKKFKSEKMLLTNNQKLFFS